MNEQATAGAEDSPGYHITSRGGQHDPVSKTNILYIILFFLTILPPPNDQASIKVDDLPGDYPGRGRRRGEGTIARRSNPPCPP